jgi:tRNA U55 pseudouridine synthase TruB
MLAPLDAVSHLPRVVVDEEGIAALRYGRALLAPGDAPEQTPVALASADGELLAIGERRGDVLQPRKVFVAQA